MARPLHTQLTPAGSLDSPHSAAVGVTAPPMHGLSFPTWDNSSVLSVRLYEDNTRWVPAQAWYLLTHHVLVRVSGGRGECGESCQQRLIPLSEGKVSSDFQKRGNRWIPEK